MQLNNNANDIMDDFSVKIALPGSEVAGPLATYLMSGISGK